MRCVNCFDLIPTLSITPTGAAAFIKTYSFTTRLVNYRTNPYSWVVAGTYVAGAYKATNTCVSAASSNHNMHIHTCTSYIYTSF